MAAKSVIIRAYLGRNDRGIDISNLIDKVRYTRSIKRDDAAEFSFSGDNAKTVLEYTQMNGGKPIHFTYGYITGEMLPPVTLILGDVEPVYDAKGNPTLVVGTVDKGHVMKRATTNRVWKDKTTKEIVSEIAVMHGLKLHARTANQLEDAGILAGTPDADNNHWIKHKSLPQANKNSMEMVQDLANMEEGGNHIAYIAGDTLNFVPRGNASKSKETITVGEHQTINQFKIKYRERTAGKSAGASMHDTIDAAKKAVENALGDPGIRVKNTFDHNAVKLDGDNISGMGLTGVNYNSGVQNINGKDYPVSVKPSGYNVPGNSINDLVKSAEDKIQATVENMDITSLMSGDTDELQEAVTNISREYQDNYSAGEKYPSPHDLSEAMNRSASNHTKAARKILTATYREYGNPLRQINTVLTFNGNIATRYMGNWYIEEVEDTISAKGDFITVSNMSKDGGKKGKLKGKGNNTKGEVRDFSNPAGDTGTKKLNLFDSNGKQIN